MDPQSSYVTMSALWLERSNQVPWPHGTSGDLAWDLLSIYGPFLTLLLEQDKATFAFLTPHDLQLFRKMLL